MSRNENANRALRTWSEDEDTYLIKNYHKLLSGFIAEHLNRSRWSVQKRAQRLGLKTPPDVTKAKQKIGSLRNRGPLSKTWKGGVSKKDPHKYIRLYCEKYPDKVKMRRQLWDAIKRGDVKKEPCLYCKSPRARVVHLSWIKYDDIIWVCMDCIKEHGYYKKKSKS